LIKYFVSFFFLTKTTISFFYIGERYRVFIRFVNHATGGVSYLRCLRSSESPVTFSEFIHEAVGCACEEKKTCDALKLQSPCKRPCVGAVSRVRRRWKLRSRQYGICIWTILDISTSALAVEKKFARPIRAADRPLRVVYIHHGKIFLRHCGRVGAGRLYKRKAQIRRSGRLKRASESRWEMMRPAVVCFPLKLYLNKVHFIAHRRWDATRGAFEICERASQLCTWYITYMIGSAIFAEKNPIIRSDFTRVGHR